MLTHTPWWWVSDSGWDCNFKRLPTKTKVPLWMINCVRCWIDPVLVTGSAEQEQPASGKGHNKDFFYPQAQCGWLAESCQASDLPFWSSISCQRPNWAHIMMDLSAIFMYRIDQNMGWCEDWQANTKLDLNDTDHSYPSKVMLAMCSEGHGAHPFASPGSSMMRGHCKHNYCG